MSEKLIIGCGYLGRRVASRWLQGGHVVHATTRSAARSEQFRDQGLQPLLADVTQPDSLKSITGLTDVETVLFAVGYDRSTGQPIHEVYVDGLRSVLAALPATVKRFIYISSTGVYGQTDGGWVDEDSPCEPTRDGGRACLAAESLLRDSRLADRTVILRLAGIYGPDRVPRKADLLASKSFPTDGHLNLIHVDDAAAAVIAAESAAATPSLYVVSDGAPVLRADYYAELRKLLGVAVAEVSDGETNDATAAKTAGKIARKTTGKNPIETSSRIQRARADKRIRSDRFRADLNIEMMFPNYRVGLAAILADGC